MSLVPCKTKSVRLVAACVDRCGPACAEKQKNNKLHVSLHGVALEMGGKGLLITGASGIGKTTTAMKAMMPGCFWIADDLAVIDKNQAGALIMTGHQKIRKYLHTDRTGIIEVIRILPASQIKNKTRLQAVIDVVRTDADAVSCELHEKEILETKLPCLRISIPNSGYFNPNLLKKAVSRFQEVG